MDYAEKIYGLLDFKLAKKFFAAAALILLVLIPLDYLAVFKNSKPRRPSSHVQSKRVSQAVPLNEYEQVFLHSSLFGNLQPGAAPSVLKASIQELTKDLRLKGVILAGTPEALIEDAKTQKTSFLQVNQTIGELKIKEIKEGEVVLTYLGEEIKLEIQ